MSACFYHLHQSSPVAQVKMKFLFCLAFLTLASFAACTNSTWGYVNPYDVILHHSIRRKSSSFMKIVTEDVKFPFPYQVNNRTITAIRVLDQVPNSKAYAQIYGGGVNFNHTIVHLKSERGKGFNFVLEIYGRN